MDKFSYLVGKRNKCLGLFNKVVNKLEKLNKEITSREDTCAKDSESREDEIATLKTKIEENNQGLEFLKSQKAINTSQIEKINNLIQ